MSEGYLKSLIFTIVSGSSNAKRGAQLMIADELEAAAVKIRTRLNATTPKPVAPLADPPATPVKLAAVPPVAPDTAASPQTVTVQPFRELSGVYTTGYYPPPAGGYKTKAEAKIEGGPSDRYGKPLRVLESFDGSAEAYVSIATDPAVIPSKSFVLIDGFPGVIFYACDVGSAIKGLHIDICVRDARATNRVTMRGRTVRVYKTRPIIS